MILSKNSEYNPQPSFRSDMALNFNKKQSEAASPTFNEARGSQFMMSLSRSENMSPNIPNKNVLKELQNSKIQLKELASVISVKNQIIDKLELRNQQEVESLQEHIKELQSQLNEEKNANHENNYSLNKLQNDSILEHTEEQLNYFQSLIKDKETLIDQVNTKYIELREKLNDTIREKSILEEKLENAEHELSIR